MPPKPRPIDYDLVRKLASIGCTDREVAAVIEITPEWLCKRQQKDEQLRAALEVGRESGKVSLRRMQWEKAKSGSTAMMIWLGKQLLGQRDRFEHTGDPGRPIATLDVRSMSNDELAAEIARERAKRAKGEE